MNILMMATKLTTTVLELTFKVSASCTKLIMYKVRHKVVERCFNCYARAAPLESPQPYNQHCVGVESLALVFIRPSYSILQQTANRNCDLLD
jgi:hypothetical protein